MVNKIFSFLSGLIGVVLIVIGSAMLSSDHKDGVSFLIYGQVMVLSAVVWDIDRKIDEIKDKIK